MCSGMNIGVLVWKGGVGMEWWLPAMRGAGVGKEGLVSKLQTKAVIAARHGNKQQ